MSGEPKILKPVPKGEGWHLVLISVHGLIRGEQMELGRDADTGGQVKYVVDLARALSKLPQVRRIDLLTRQVIDERVSADYGQLEEVLTDKARIIRIPFGPKRYLYKESLWPFMDMFVDQALTFFRKSGGPPDVIHGHYADAGYAGAQLARLLAVPFLFTGHSLGRVKRQRLLMGKGGHAEKLDAQYNFAQRIEAEEHALETASVVITSTHQEVEEQYQLYHHYATERMQVIPPGVNLEEFSPPQPGDAEPAFVEHLRPFLTDLSRPAIIAMARPDERKNLEMLVRV